MWPEFFLASGELIFHLFVLPHWEVGVRESMDAAGLHLHTSVFRIAVLRAKSCFWSLVFV